MLSNDVGTVRPSILAVEALMTNSTLVDTNPSGSLRSSLRLRISNLWNVLWLRGYFELVGLDH